MIQKKYSVATILLLLNFICAGSFNLSSAGAGAGSNSKLSQALPGQNTPRRPSSQVVDSNAAFRAKALQYEARKPESWSRYFACYTKKTPAQAAKKRRKVRG